METDVQKKKKTSQDKTRNRKRVSCRGLHRKRPEREREREREREKEIHRTFSVANVCNITSTATEIRTTTRHEDSSDATTAVDPVQEQEQEERSLTRFQNVVSKPLAQALFFLLPPTVSGGDVDFETAKCGQK
jgi:hypothetical protein